MADMTEIVVPQKDATDSTALEEDVLLEDPPVDTEMHGKAETNEENAEDILEEDIALPA